MSIRTKLTIIMLFLGLVPTIIVSVIAYITISNGLVRKTVDQLVSTASKQEQKINGLLQKKQEEAISLTNKYDLQSALGQYLGSEGGAAQDDLNAILLDKKLETPDIQTINLLNLQGKVVATTIRGNEGKQLTAADYSVPEGEETATTVREDERDGINKLYVTAKVSVNKKEAGYMSVIFRIDDIVAAIQDYTGLGATGETMVAERDAQGNAISLFPLRFNTDAARQTRLNPEIFTPFPNGYKDLSDYRNKQTMVSAKSIGFANWVIATKIDRDEALVQIDQMGATLISMVLAFSLAITFIALYLTRYFTKPILRIAEAAQQIGKGNLSARIDLRRGDEIGTLGESINTMGISLQEFVTSIEGQRNRLQIILNSILESILAIDKQGNILIANRAAAELTGLKVEEIVGKNINDIFKWQKDDETFDIDYAQADTTAYTNLQYKNAGGATHYVRLIVARVSGAQEQAAAQTIVTIHDETKTREFEDMKVDFVSMAAHELRTPLAAIRGYLELVRFSSGLGRDADKYLHQALKSTTELGGLINNLLDVSRIEHGTLTFNLEKIDLATEVKQAIEDARFSAQDKHISVSYAGPEDGCDVIADQIALREVINNLISNAIKYTGPKGKVDVTLKEGGGEYTVSVKDTGEGISKEAQAKLFTKFYRVHRGLNSGSTGTGLGLFIAKSIIERHDGTITCVSKEGIGSTFTFTLPFFNQERFTTLQSVHQSASILTRKKHGWITKNTTR